MPTAQNQFIHDTIFPMVNDILEKSTDLHEVEGLPEETEALALITSAVTLLYRAIEISDENLDDILDFVKATLIDNFNSET